MEIVLEYVLRSIRYALFIAYYIRGESENAKRLRRTIVRYLCLTQVFVFRDISVQVQKRFPTADSMVDAGILLKEEKEKLDSIKLQYNKYWAPMRWIHAIALEARKNEIIPSDLFYWKLCSEIDNFRYNLQLLCNYDWVPIPLVYSQVVFLAVYVHFIACLISRQFIVSNNTSISDLDLIVPIMTIIQFVFFIGWLKVAQALLNPFGDDDDDFECNYLIDKNLATSFCIVDNYDRAPEVRPDLFWRSHKALSASTNTPLIGSVANLKIMTRNQVPSASSDRRTDDLEKTMKRDMTCQYHSEEPIRSSIQLAQHNTSQIKYFVLPDPNMTNNNNEVETTRL
ncbi:Bestrophin [Onchocerca flexuosa]|uniref:Bestrophin homolog n=1 Tax=Onchocerca flexuosa TaxID=387005 RepID=A0A238BSH6_9BILA|nr:Bestrophin [Onchocerca flexuosa]